MSHKINVQLFGGEAEVFGGGGELPPSRYIKPCQLAG